MTIKVYGFRADDISQGQQFIANVTYVEGRKVVELKPIEKVWTDEEIYDREMETRSDDY